MTLYPFETQLAVAAEHPEVVMQSSAITFYDPADTAMATPLDLLDPNGLPTANPVTTTAVGLVPAFQASMPHVRWSDGTYSGYLSSYKGMLAEAIAARAAAEAAIINGMPPGGASAQILAKYGSSDYAAAWKTLIVIIGPSDAWPTGLADGTLVVRTET